jgi:hypothetical protein
VTDLELNGKFVKYRKFLGEGKEILRQLARWFSKRKPPPFDKLRAGFLAQRAREKWAPGVGTTLKAETTKGTKVHEGNPRFALDSRGRAVPT